VSVSRRLDRGVEPQTDATWSALEQGAQTADRLGIDERSGGQRRAQIFIGLADAVDDDAVGREPGADGERQLDGTHDLGAETIGGKTPKERGIGIRLDGVRHERTGQCGGPGSAARRRGVEIGDVEGRSPALGSLDEQLGHRAHCRLLS